MLLHKEDVFDWSHAANVLEPGLTQTRKLVLETMLQQISRIEKKNLGTSANNEICGSLFWEIQGRGWPNERCNGLGMEIQKTAKTPLTFTALAREYCVLDRFIMIMILTDWCAIFLYDCYQCSFNPIIIVGTAGDIRCCSTDGLSTLWQRLP